MRTVSSPARPQSTLLPPNDDQPYPLSDSMSFTSTSTLHDELNSIWAPKNSSTDFSGMSHNCSPWPLETEPQFWTKTQVWQWFQHVFNTHRIDTASLPFLNFDIDGHQLCSMSYHDFILAAGSIGHVLFQSIEELKWNGLYLRGTKCSEESFGCNHHETDIRFPVEGAATEIRKIEMCSPHVELLRPEVSATPSIPKKKKSRNVSCRLGKYTPRGAHLWEFIRDILLSNESKPGLIRWEDRTAGVFRILRSDAVAQLWGKKKNNSSMTYEKLSRAMRYYYKRGILERVDGQRLVYKFGRNASGWKESDK